MDTKLILSNDKILDDINGMDTTYEIYGTFQLFTLSRRIVYIN